LSVSILSPLPKSPIRLTPSPREKVWGRKRLAPWFPDSERNIGEVWFLAETELPLLVKLLFTSEKLSIQVHPDDGEGVARGKTEMWHILEAEPGAQIGLGFRESISRERLLEACVSGEIEQLVNWFPVKAGETYFTPAHTVHAIGAGIILCEIQQHSDVTYRLWDYGRPREMHLERGVAVAHTGVHPGPAKPVAVENGRDLLVRSRHFVTEAVCLPPGASYTPSPEPCQLLVVVEGCGTMGGRLIESGEVWYLSEEVDGSGVCTDEGLRMLRTYVP
jgi:mannose-6-phosphate isomerase